MSDNRVELRAYEEKTFTASPGEDLGVPVQGGSKIETSIDLEIAPEDITYAVAKLNSGVVFRIEIENDQIKATVRLIPIETGDPA